MKSLRYQMIHEMELHRKSPRTIEAYVMAVSQLAGYYNRSPDQISVGEVREWMHYLITEKKLAFSSCNQKLAGVRFFYRQVLQQPEFGVELRIPTKRTGRLPEPLSRSEIVRLLDAASSTKARMMLITCYATGVRLSELLNLRLEDVHSERMVVRVRQGKGRKDRYTLLSPRLLTELEGILATISSVAVVVRKSEAWRTIKSFESPKSIPVRETALRYHPRTGDPHVTPFVRNAPSGNRTGSTDDSKTVGAYQSVYHSTLSPRDQSSSAQGFQSVGIVAISPS